MNKDKNTKQPAKQDKVDTVIHFPNEMTTEGKATLLKGFATEIQSLVVPQLYVVQRIGKNIGLVIMTRQEFDAALTQTKDVIEDVEETMAVSQQLIDSLKDPLQAVRLILASSMSTDDKLIKIAELVKK